MELKKLSIIIPCYNEKFTVEPILLKVLCSPVQMEEKEIVIVDDYSTDGTRDIISVLSSDWNGSLKKFLNRWLQKHPENTNYKELFEANIKKTRFKFVTHEKNQGKGAAMRTGIEHATGDIILVQDADLEYDPFEYPKLLEPLLKGKAEVVYGSRYLGESRRTLGFWHTLINKSLTTLSNIMSGLKLTDVETCYKVFKSSIIKPIYLRSNRFGFDPEVTAKVARLGNTIHEVPISYSGRTYKEGKKIGVKDGFQTVWCIFKYNLLPVKILKDINKK